MDEGKKYVFAAYHLRIHLACLGSCELQMADGCETYLILLLEEGGDLPRLGAVPTNIPRAPR